MESRRPLFVCEDGELPSVRDAAALLWRIVSFKLYLLRQAWRLRLQWYLGQPFVAWAIAGASFGAACLTIALTVWWREIASVMTAAN